MIEQQDFNKKKFLLICNAISRKISTEIFPNRYWIKLFCINKINKFMNIF